MLMVIFSGTPLAHFMMTFAHMMRSAILALAVRMSTGFLGLSALHAFAVDFLAGHFILLCELVRARNLGGLWAELWPASREGTPVFEFRVSLTCVVKPSGFPGTIYGSDILD